MVSWDEGGGFADAQPVPHCTFSMDVREERRIRGSEMIGLQAFEHCRGMTGQPPWCQLQRERLHSVQPMPPICTASPVDSAL
jgi:hypothetical protein